MLILRQGNSSAGMQKAGNTAVQISDYQKKLIAFRYKSGILQKNTAKNNAFKKDRRI